MTTMTRPTCKETGKQVKGIILLVIPVALLTAVLVSGFCFAADSTQKTFSSPNEAFRTMVAALKDRNVNELTAIFGPDEKEIFSADLGAGQKSREWFLKAYEEKNSVVTVDENKAVLHVGKEDWSWPVPVIKTDERWRFDTEEAKKEIRTRRISQNEKAAIRVCLAYVEAQLQYYAQVRPKEEPPGYAREFVGVPGREEGLCSVVEESGPLGSFMAGACEAAENTKRSNGKAEPYHGYYYKILTKQGPDARSGAYDYVVKGRMTRGFALVAYPAFYNSSGIMTFIVNQDDVVYQKDLGPQTEKKAGAMTTYNPDQSWTQVGY